VGRRIGSTGENRLPFTHYSQKGGKNRDRHRKSSFCGGANPVGLGLDGMFSARKVNVHLVGRSAGFGTQLRSVETRDPLYKEREVHSSAVREENRRAAASGRGASPSSPKEGESTFLSRGSVSPFGGPSAKKKWTVPPLKKGKGTRPGRTGERCLKKTPGVRFIIEKRSSLAGGKGGNVFLRGARRR